MDDHDQPVNRKKEENNCVIRDGVSAPFAKMPCVNIPENNENWLLYSVLTENDEDISSPKVQSQSNLIALCRTNYCNNQKTTQKVHFHMQIDGEKMFLT